MIDATLAHGWTGLALGYAAVQMPMIAGLIRGHAKVREYLLAPIVSVPLAVVGAGGAAIFAALVPLAGSAAASGLKIAIGTAISGAIGYASGRIIARDGREDHAHVRGAQVCTELIAAPRQNAAGSRSRNISF